MALIHSFRQDGIAPNPAIPDQDGISPYSPSGHQFVRFAETLRLIPGNALMFPNNSITDVERVRSTCDTDCRVVFTNLLL